MQRYRVLAGAPPQQISAFAQSAIAQHQVFSSRQLYAEGSLYHIDLGDISVSHLGFGSNTLIKGNTWQDSYYIEFLTAGHLELRSQGKSQLVGTDSIVLVPPHHAVNFDFSPECRKLIVRIKKPALLRHLGQFVPLKQQAELHFSPITPTSHPGVGSLLRAIKHLCDELDDPHSTIQSGLFKRNSINLILDNLLSAIPHSHSHLIDQLLRTDTPAFLQLAEHFIAKSLELPIELRDIVQASGTSERNLYKLFRQYRGTTPMGYLKTQRLREAHNVLTHPAAGTANKTITDIALACGFTHLGNFATDYKKYYGQLPSETLQHTKRKL